MGPAWREPPQFERATTVALKNSPLANAFALIAESLFDKRCQ
jgi:hypothetical protein